MSAMRLFAPALALAMMVVGCTRNVDDLPIYERCFLDRECDDVESNGCFQLRGPTRNMGICSRYCETSACPDDGVCSDRYDPEEDTGTVMPICVQACGDDADCPEGGFTCNGGACLPP